jgi:hypothetical protein
MPGHQACQLKLRRETLSHYYPSLEKPPINAHNTLITMAAPLRYLYGLVAELDDIVTSEDVEAAMTKLLGWIRTISLKK